MADVKISELPNGTISRSSVVPVSRITGNVAVTEKLTVEDIGSINFKRPVRLATTTNIGSLYGTTYVIDGVEILAGDRILVKDQNVTSQNGIYIVNELAWTRSTDFNSSDKVTKGQVVFVREGQQNRTTTWMLTNADGFDFVNPSIDAVPLMFVKCRYGNVDISENYIYSTNENGNLLIIGTGTGSVFIENLRVQTRAISTDVGSNISITTRDAGTVLINSRSNASVIVGNLQIQGERISTTNSSNVIFSSSSLFGNILLNNNRITSSEGNVRISSNDGNVIINNVLINGNKITSSLGGGVVVGDFIISGNTIRNLSGNLLITHIGSNLVFGSSQSTPLLLSGNLLLPIATVNYVDSALNFLDLKSSVKVATTSNISLSSTQIIDGVNVAIGDRILVKNQTNGILNGIYIVGSNSWVLSSDNVNFGQFTPGMFVFVEEGNTQADTGWILTNDRSRMTGNSIIDGSYDFAKFTGGSTSSNFTSANIGNIRINSNSIRNYANNNVIIDGNLVVNGLIISSEGIVSAPPSSNFTSANIGDISINSNYIISNQIDSNINVKGNIIIGNSIDSNLLINANRISSENNEIIIDSNLVINGTTTLSNVEYTNILLSEISSNETNSNIIAHGNVIISNGIDSNLLINANRISSENNEIIINSNLVINGTSLILNEITSNEINSNINAKGNVIICNGIDSNLLINANKISSENNEIFINSNLVINGTFTSNSIDTYQIFSDIDLQYWPSYANKYQLIAPQSNLNIYFDNDNSVVKKGKEIIIKNTDKIGDGISGSGYILSIYNGLSSNSPVLLTTLQYAPTGTASPNDKITAWFVYDGNNWQLILTSND